jgi:putative heme iron utilization protein
MDLSYAVRGDLDELYLNLWSGMALPDADQRNLHGAMIQTNRASYLKAIQELKANASQPEEKRAIENVEATVAAAREVNNRVLDLAAQGQGAEGMKLMGKEGDAHR